MFYLLSLIYLQFYWKSIFAASKNISFLLLNIFGTVLSIRADFVALILLCTIWCVFAHVVLTVNYAVIYLPKQRLYRVLYWWNFVPVTNRKLNHHNIPKWIVGVLWFSSQSKLTWRLLNYIVNLVRFCLWVDDMPRNGIHMVLLYVILFQYLKVLNNQRDIISDDSIIS